jgi:hypothetical protein
MARRGYAFYGGDLSGWPKGMVPTPPILRNLDQYSSELVNGEDGGTWAPADPIVIGSAVAPAVAFSNSSSLLSGDVETVKGNSAHDNYGRTGLVLGGNANPVLQSARTRVVVVHFAMGQDVRSGATGMPREYVLDPVTFGMKVARAGAGTNVLMVPVPLRAQHAGSTITQVQFRYKIGVERTSLPVTADMPRFRISKLPNSSSAGGPLQSSTSTPYDSLGFYVDQAATVADYFNNGNTRTATYACNQNNVVDSNGSYWVVEAKDEGIATGVAGNVYLTATITLTTPADFRPE